MMENIDLLAGVVIVGIFLIYIIAVSIIKHKSIWEAVVGEDGRLQMPELILASALLLFILIVVLDAGFDKHTSENITYSVDTILMIALGGKITNDHLSDKRKSEPKNDKPNE